MDSRLRKFTLEELRQLNESTTATTRKDARQGIVTQSDIWLSCDDWVIKVPANYVDNRHPGGRKAMETVMAPKNCSMFFNTIRGGIGHSDQAINLLRMYVVGFTSDTKPNYEVLSVKRGREVGNMQQLAMIALFIVLHVFLFWKFIS
mmetsp:Transcript_16572/g.20102  ORF Transcript_16572/g.20102 Transcript_16572/m.20102 type:complete len:147 (+) Transcript_16572:146-586(+)